MVNQDQTELIRPVFGSNSKFEFLVKGKNLNNSILWLTFSALFLISSIFLASILVYLRLIRKSKTVKQDVEKSESKTYDNFDASSNYSSSFGTCSYTTTDQLKIRNDFSETSLESPSWQSSNMYQEFNYNYEKLVPSKLDILLNKKPISAENSQFVEVSSIKELSEDQGVYCLATGTSFTSNFSSVSNSHCVDTEHDISSGYSIDVNERVEKTRLSLFDLTPIKQLRQMEDSSRFDQEINQIFTSKGLRSSVKTNQDQDQIKKWVMVNYSVNCYDKNFSFETQSSISSNIATQNDLINECII